MSKGVFETDFVFGDRVNIDGCKSLVAVVVGIRFFAKGHIEYLLAWFNEGTPKQETFDSWRLSEAEGD